MIKNSYSFWGYLRLAIFVIRTKFISSKARIIRFPIEIRGKRFIRALLEINLVRITNIANRKYPQKE